MNRELQYHGEGSLKIFVVKVYYLMYCTDVEHYFTGNSCVMRAASSWCIIHTRKNVYNTIHLIIMMCRVYQMNINFLSKTTTTVSVINRIFGGESQRGVFRRAQ